MLGLVGVCLERVAITAVSPSCNEQQLQSILTQDIASMVEVVCPFDWEGDDPKVKTLREPALNKIQMLKLALEIADGDLVLILDDNMTLKGPAALRSMFSNTLQITSHNEDADILFVDTCGMSRGSKM